MLAEQILFASVIIITKIDTIPDSAVNAQAKAYRNQPTPQLLFSPCRSAFAQLDATLAPILNVSKVAEQFGLTNEFTAGSVDALVIRDPRPFHPKDCMKLVAVNLGQVFIVQKVFFGLLRDLGKF